MKNVTNILSDLFVKVDFRITYAVNNTMFCSIPGGPTIKVEPITVNEKPALQLSTITKYHGQIDSTIMPLPYGNGVMPWHHAITDDELQFVADNIKNYIDAFRNMGER